MALGPTNCSVGCKCTQTQFSHRPHACIPNPRLPQLKLESCVAQADVNRVKQGLLLDSLPSRNSLTLEGSPSAARVDRPTPLPLGSPLTQGLGQDPYTKVNVVDLFKTRQLHVHVSV